MHHLFYELIRVSLNIQEELSRVPSETEWKDLFELSKKQCLVGINFIGVQKLRKSSQNNYDNLPKYILLNWMNITANIQEQNALVNKQCKKVNDELTFRDIRCIILKGQSLAPYYGELAKYRQSGDIDVWCKGKTIVQLVDFLDKIESCYEAKYAHVSCQLFKETEVEFHSTPALLRCPWKNVRLQKWFKGIEEPSLEFNIVFLLVHMYHHVLFEGIGLRQFMDYYLCLKKFEGRDKTHCVLLLKRFGLYKFAQGVMYIMKDIFGINQQALLVTPDPKIGSLLLQKAMEGGNFGHYDKKYIENKSRNLMIKGWYGFRKKLPLFALGPWEILFSPIWSIWQISWRKFHHYC